MSGLAKPIQRPEIIIIIGIKYLTSIEKHTHTQLSHKNIANLTNRVEKGRTDHGIKIKNGMLPLSTVAYFPLCIKEKNLKPHPFNFWCFVAF